MKVRYVDEGEICRWRWDM